MTDGAGDNSNGVGKLYLVDSYKEFVEAEGIPMVTGFSADCLTLPLEPWERLGGLGPTCSWTAPATTPIPT